MQFHRIKSINGFCNKAAELWHDSDALTVEPEA